MILQSILDKIVTIDKAKVKRDYFLSKDETVVFTNGCFDILHEGHVTYLAKSAELGKRLIVGINSDLSVKKLGKGSERPINNEKSRSLILACLSFVDLVVVFNDDTPIDLISYLLPDILVKGADYDANETNPNSKKFIIGSNVIKKNGGEVKTLDLIQGFSTTNIISKIQK